MRIPFLAAALVAATAHAQTTVDLAAELDASLYENDFGDLANGAGQFLFTGQTVQADMSTRLRRLLVQFDIAGAVPAGSTITDVSLTLNMSRTIAGNTNVNAHRVTSDWGEGTSDAFGQEGGGTVSTPDSATWIHTFWNGSSWNSPGGDFDPTVSASTSVGGIGFYTWTGAGLVSDAQSFLDNPATNHGWMLIGNEVLAPTAKRFDSREHPTVANRPVLSVTYEAGSTACSPADITTEGTANGVPDGMVTLSDFSYYLNLWAASDPAADITTTGMCNFGMGGDGVDLSDFSCYLSEWSLGCP